MEITSSCAITNFDNLVNRRIVLVLQGGGALGAFQAGVYETLEKIITSPTGLAAPPLVLSMPVSLQATRQRTA